MSKIPNSATLISGVYNSHCRKAARIHARADLTTDKQKKAAPIKMQPFSLIAEVRFYRPTYFLPFMM